MYVQSNPMKKISQTLICNVVKETIN